MDVTFVPRGVTNMSSNSGMSLITLAVINRVAARKGVELTRGTIVIVRVTMNLCKLPALHWKAASFVGITRFDGSFRELPWKITVG